MSEIKILTVWWIKYFMSARVLLRAVAGNLYFGSSHCHSLQFGYTFRRGLVHKISQFGIPICKPNFETGSRDYKCLNPGSRDWESNPVIAIINCYILNRLCKLTYRRCNIITKFVGSLTIELSVMSHFVLEFSFFCTWALVKLLAEYSSSVINHSASTALLLAIWSNYSM